MHHLKPIRYIIFSLAVVLFLLSSFSMLNSTQNHINVTAIEAIKTKAIIAHNRSFKADEIIEEIPTGAIKNHAFGHAEAEIKIVAPDTLAMNNTLVALVSTINIDPGLKCLLSLHLDGVLVIEEFVITGEELPEITADFEVSRDMAPSVHLKAALRHATKEGIITLKDEKTVILENHSKSYWMELNKDRVEELVTSSYKGNRTLEWARENDYDDFDKEVFVNLVKGYESETDYLIWVNRTYQRANIFEKESDGNWRLTKTFIIATGGQGKATKRGVSKIPSRTNEGWHFGHFKVEPVVRFYPGTGYAFHSRPLHPRTGEVTDKRIGFPVSSGCIRMYCDDIWYIYDNIPDGTTVVIH